MIPHRHLYREEGNEFTFCEAIDFPKWIVGMGSSLVVHGTARGMIFYHLPEHDTYWMVKRSDIYPSDECPFC